MPSWRFKPDKHWFSHPLSIVVISVLLTAIVPYLAGIWQPTSKVEVKYDGSRLIKLTKVDDNEVSLPLFSMLYISVYTLSGKLLQKTQS